MLLATLLPVTVVGAAPIIRSQAWSLTSTGEAYRESSTLTEGTIFPNCSYLKVSNVTAEVSECSTVDVGSCNKSFVLLHGVKAVCAAAGTPAGCTDRGDAFCCYSTSAAPLCDKAFLRDKRPRRVRKCTNLRQRKALCQRSFEMHGVGDPRDRVIVVACGFDKGCVGRSSSTSQIACCQRGLQR